MWTPTTRQQHSRPVTRYQTDLTDAQWRVIAPHMPKPCAMGRPREWPMRKIVNGIFYGREILLLDCIQGVGQPWRVIVRLHRLHGDQLQRTADNQSQGDLTDGRTAQFTSECSSDIFVIVRTVAGCPQCNKLRSGSMRLGCLSTLSASLTTTSTYPSCVI
jgi:Putative transposase of IS4/5 family (DUF4096)